MKCKDCEHLHIIQEPLRGLRGEIYDMGRVECDKHNLYTDFANHGILEWLSCIEDEEGRDTE